MESEGSKTTKMCVLLGSDWALQHPSGYLEALYNVVPAVIKESVISTDDIIGIGIDFTSCTILPVKKDGTPVCGSCLQINVKRVKY